VVGSKSGLSLENLLGKLDHALSSGFSGSDNLTSGTNQSVTPDLSQTIAGASTSSDLTNVGQFVQLAGQTSGTSNTSGSTTFEIAGSSGHTAGTADDSGKLGLQNMLDKHLLNH
jgi:hypothetical protein